MAEKLFERVMEGVMFDDDPGVSGALLLYSTYCLGFREFFFYRSFASLSMGSLLTLWLG